MINWLMLLKEIIAVYCENYMKLQSGKSAKLFIINGDMYSYH
jgi:hypothetical protein